VKNNFTFLFVLFFLAQFLMAQGSVEKVIRGQVTVEAIPVEGVNVINTFSKINTVSDQYGNFSILAKDGDVLSLSSVNYEPLRKYISKQEYNLGTIVVSITAISIELKEVIINDRPDITAENLGIIPRDQIKLTPAERKVYTATSGTDALINYFSGRTKILKKELEVERKEVLMQKLEYLFEDKYYIETLKIPEDEIKGFQYYCVEDSYFENALNSKNKTMCMFFIVGLASNYNKNKVLDKNEKKF
jgi:hypothetical protein